MVWNNFRGVGFYGFYDFWGFYDFCLLCQDFNAVICMMCNRVCDFYDILAIYDIYATFFAGYVMGL